MSRLVAASLGRHLLRHPLQLSLAVLGIALGVAVVLAVDLANHSAHTSFKLSMDRLTGQATHHVVGGPAGLDEQLFVQLRLQPGVRAAPVVEGFATAGTRRVRIVGIDPLSEGGFGRWAGGDDGGYDITRLMTERDAAVWADDGDEVLDVVAGGTARTLQRIGTLTGPGTEALVIVDIATAQNLLSRVGRLDRIDLRLPDGTDGEALAQTIETLLPPDAALEAARVRSTATAALSDAFRTNLTALSLLALVVGMFLIYNTMSFAVVQRRHLFGMLRALGVERAALFRAILWEAALLGAAGTALGILLGIALAGGLLQLVARTIDDLYHAMEVSRLHFSATSLLRAVTLGVGAALVAALLPARESSECPPGSALSRIELEDRWRRARPRLAMAAFALAGVGLLLLWAHPGLVSGFAALFMILLACALVTVPLLHGVSGLLERLPLPLEAAMAGRDLGRHLSRTGVAAAALMVALSTGVGVGVMVDSFRSGVDGWLRQLLNADLYIAPAGRGSTGLDAHVVERLRAHETGAAVSLYRQRELLLGGRIAYLIAADLSPPSLEGYQLISARGDPWPAWTRGEALLVSEPLAYRLGIVVGDALTLPAPSGHLTLPVAGVFRDYGSEHGRVLLALGTYRRAWADGTVGSAAVFAPPDTVGQLRAALAQLQPLRFSTHGEVLQASLAVFDRTFTITGVLRLLAVLVAFVGVLGALLAMGLERAREFAVLRAIGMTPPELSRLVALETGLLGLAAGLAALPTGVILARLLLEVINRRAFGWSLPFEVAPGLLVQTVVLAVIAALLAGIVPMRRLATTPPASALRTE